MGTRRFACQPVCTPERQQTYHLVLATALTTVKTIIEASNVQVTYYQKQQATRRRPQLHQPQAGD